MNRKVLGLAMASGICLSVLGGCASRNKPEPTPPAPTTDQAEALKSTLREVNKNVKIGTVTAVVEDVMYAMVADVDLTGVKAGDVFSFVDAQGGVVANGVVLEIVNTKLALRYEAVTRAPLTGDLAVKF